MLNWEALLAFLSPYFFLSFILGSLVKKPAALSAALFSGSAWQRALEIPWRSAPLWPVVLYFAACRKAYDPVSAMGELCGLSQYGRMAAEPIS